MQFGQGDIIAQRYRLDEKLGEGGMGAVWRAEHVVTGRKLAVKLLDRRVSSDAAATERFLREARAPAAIGHPGVVDILDAGTDDGGSAFIAMELLEGETFAALIQRDRVVQPVMLAAVMDPLLTALGAMHDRGFVHRDLKPANVFLCQKEGEPLRVKLLDFGITRAMDDEGGHTNSGMVLGTPAYMAPEQMRNARNATVKSDLWSVGVMLYESLTGHRPFRGETFGLLARISGPHPAPLLGDVAPHLPEPLCLLVDALLSKDVNERPADALEVRAQLLDALAECPTLHAVDPPPDEEMEQAPRSAEPKRTPRSSPGSSQNSGVGSSGSMQRAPRSRKSTPIPGTAEIAPPRPPPMPWGRALAVGGLFAAASFGAVMYFHNASGSGKGSSTNTPVSDAGTRVTNGNASRDASTNANANANANANTNVPQGEMPLWCANAKPLAQRQDLRATLTHWHDAVTTTKGEGSLASYYFEHVHWRKAGPSTVDQIQSGWAGIFSRGGDFHIPDWSRACVVEEPFQAQAARHDQCDLPNAKGPVLLVKVRATETVPGRAAQSGNVVPCDNLDGLYLLRVRSTGRSYRICNETWSLCEGVCASCQQSTACAQCRAAARGS